MAFNVSYIFKAIDQFSAVAAKIKRSLGAVKSESNAFGRAFNKTSVGIKRSAAKIARSVKAMGRGVAAAGRGMRRALGGVANRFTALVATAGAFLGGAALIREGSAFQTSMADLSAITGAVGKDFDMLKEKTLAMAKASKISQTDVAESIKLVASAKPELLRNLPVLLATTEQMLLLSNASGLDLATATRAGVQALNTFGRGAEFASKFVNILAAGAKEGSSEVGETAEALRVSGGAAKSAGLDFLSLNIAIQAMAKGGIKGSEAGTALNAMFGRLQAKGIDFKKIGIKGAFLEIKKALDNTTDATEKALLAQELFGLEHAKSGFAILENLSIFDSLRRRMTGTNVASEQAQIRLATFSKKMEGLSIVIKDKLIRIFDKLEPTFSRLAVQAEKFVDSITPAQIETIANGIKNFTLGAVELGQELGKNLIPFVREFMASMDTAAVGNIVSNIATIGNAVTAIITPFKVIFSIVKGVWQIIGELAAAIATLDFSQFTSLREKFSIGGKLFGVIDVAPDASAAVAKSGLSGKQSGKSPGAFIPSNSEDIKKFRETTSLSLVPAGLSVSTPLTAPGQATQPFAAPGQVVSPAVDLTGQQSVSKADITVQIKAPEGVVQSIQTQRSGDTEGMNLGVNMQSAG